ncbi:MAG: HNH endonuclease signature motif containing protein [Candidatus Omnitrophota bacterium]
MITIPSKQIPLEKPLKQYTYSMERTKPCVHCGKVIQGMPSFVRIRKYCSQKCCADSRRAIKKKEWVKITCQVCGKEFEVTPAWFKNGRRKYCSRKCHGRAPQKRRMGPHADQTIRVMSELAKGKHLREKSSQWKGGKYLDGAGYRHVIVSALSKTVQNLVAPMTMSNGYLLEHRLVMALKLNRPLEKNEVVHHLNGIKNDNQPENLFLSNRKEHSISHRELERELILLRKENKFLRSLVKPSHLDGLDILSTLGQKVVE